MSDIEKYSDQTFESIKHVTENGEEFWYARELQGILEYVEWRNFYKVIESAVLACKNSGNEVTHHFVEVNKTIVMPKSAEKHVTDYKLSRFACYLIVMNGNPKKAVIAVGQTYFAVKTRQNELIENYGQLTEDERRLEIRGQMTIHNKSLFQSAKMAGVDNFGFFQNKGYQGLYGGLGQREIHKKKGLKKSQQILDHMGSTELAANLFRATQTEDKLRHENIRGTQAASQAHYDIGVKVRKVIKDIGGTMPELLPTPEKSIKQIERESKKKLKNSDDGILPIE
ncbi:MAG: DNA damage-inducible protein D [Fibromonadales bacterium]|nr:DNA damage-inducible protein D [Fibromonadales bacterium]